MQNFNTYNELIDHFRCLDLKPHQSEYVEKHHIIPIAEGGKEDGDVVYLPINYHVLAHYLRGLEWEKRGNISFAWKNYNSVIRCINQNCLPASVKDLEKKMEAYVKAKEAWMKLNKEHGSVFFTDGKVNRRLLTFEVEAFTKENPQFKRGQTKKVEEKRWIHNGKDNTYLPIAIAEDFLKHNPDWKYGMAPTKPKVYSNGKPKPTTLGKKTINKDGKMKNVFPEELPKYLSQGWLLGHTHSPAKRIKLVNNSTGKIISIFPKQIGNMLTTGWKYADS